MMNGVDKLRERCFIFLRRRYRFKHALGLMTLVSLFTACALDMRAVEQSDNPLSLYFADTLSESGIYAAAVEKFLPHVIEKTSTDEIRKLSTSDVLAQG